MKITNTTSATAPDDGDNQPKNDCMAKSPSKQEADAISPQFGNEDFLTMSAMGFQTKESASGTTKNDDPSSDSPPVDDGSATQSGDQEELKYLESRGYTSLKFCGKGAFGSVYCGQDTSGREMAIKIILKKEAKDYWERELEGIRNYAKNVENSPELLQIFSVVDVKEHDFIYYTMEKADPVSGLDNYKPDTLANRLKDGALPPRDALDILLAVFSCIKILHNVGLAHRDIKPENILFIKGKPKLGDIGLISDLNRKKTTQVVGTYGYLPPEAFSIASPSEENRLQWDLYAFGKVIYQVFTGELDARKWPEIPANITLNAVSSKFNDLSAKLCTKDPTKRMHSIKKIDAALDKIRIIEKEYSRNLETSQHKDKCKMWFWLLLGISIFESIVILFFVIQPNSDDSDIVKRYNEAVRLYQDGGTRTAKGTAIDMFETLAKDNNYAPAQYMLGYCYENDPNFKDIKKAFDYYRKSADNRNADAQYALGRCYSENIGTEYNKKDYAEAFFWWRTAAEFGNHAKAQYEVGLLYKNAQGLGQNLKEAFEWFQKAANQGIPDAQYELAEIYANPKLAAAYGKGIDAAKANRYYSDAAKQRHQKARERIVAKFPRAQIAGVTMQNNTNIIERVDPQTAAETRLKSNDKIVQIDEEIVNTKVDIDYLLLLHDPNTNEYTKKASVTLKIERDGKEDLEITVPVQ